MTRIVPLRLLRITFLVALVSWAAASAFSQEAPTMSADQRVAALKKNLAEDQARLRQYAWTETTIVSLKGEEKSRTLAHCSYGADGKVQKVPVETPEAKGKPGLRGKIVEKKKEEISDYMKQAVALVKTYVPPDPAKLQASKGAGKMSLTETEPGKRARLDFHDYNLAGDVLGVEVDLTTNRLLGVQVSTYLSDPKDVVTLKVSAASLPDGTGYPGQIILDAKAQSVTVRIQNAEYKKVGS